MHFLHCVERRQRSPKQILPHVTVKVMSRFHIPRVVEYVIQVEVAFDSKVDTISRIHIPPI